MQMAELQHTRRTSAVSTCAAVSTGSSRVARTILAEEVVAARKQLPGPGHRSTWARPAEHDAIVNPQHLHELHGAYVRAGARARACSRTQSGTALDETGAEAKRVQKESATWTAEEVAGCHKRQCSFGFLMGRNSHRYR